MELEASLPREEFNRLSALKRDDEARRLIEKDREEQLLDAREEREGRDLNAFAAFVEEPRGFAEKLETFVRKLEKLDTATVQALMQNEVELRKAQQDIDRLLAQAHVLADGRRVFKTEDGKRVFDEHGVVVDVSIIDLSAIRRDAPSWETFADRNATLDGLAQERQELNEFQRKVDSAQERVADNDLNDDDIAALDAVLEAEKPARVRALMNEPHPQSPAASPESARIVPTPGLGVPAL
jgi:hypothetical protein